MDLTLKLFIREDKKKWVEEFRLMAQVLGDEIKLNIEKGNLNEIEKEQGDLFFIDAQLTDTEEKIKKIDRSSKSVILILEDSLDIPEIYLDEKVDDILIYPFRSLEILAKLKSYYQVMKWIEIESLNENFSKLAHKMNEDLELAERLQLRRLPKKFPEVPGFNVESRYLVGMKSGGDYFDLTSTEKGGPFSVILTDSSSYGLSSAVMSSLISLAVKLSPRSKSSEFLSQVYEDLQATLSEKDHLSFFRATIDPRRLEMNYIHYGNTFIARYSPEKGTEIIPPHGEVIRQSEKRSFPEEGLLRLSPSERLVLLSDGYVEGVGGQETVLSILEEFRKAEPQQLLNELTYRIKKVSGGEKMEDFPEQDCTGLILDVNQNALRLA